MRILLLTQVVPAPPDTTPPTVTAVGPQDGATGVALGVVAVAGFSEPVIPGTISFVLRDPANNVVPSTMTYDGATTTARLQPVEGL